MVILKWGVFCLCGFFLLSAGCCIAKNVDAFCCPGSFFVNASSFGHLPENHLGNKGTSFHGHLEEHVFPSIAWGIERRKPTSVFCQNKFGGVGLKELYPNFISSIKSPVKPPELQRINKCKMWLYMNVLTTEMWNDILQTTCLWLIIQRNSRMRQTEMKQNVVLIPQMQAHKITWTRKESL